MKSLSGWVAARCDEHQFRAKIKVSTWTVFELSLFEQSRNEERIRKMALLLPHTFAFSCLLCGFWATMWVLLIMKTLKEEAWELKWAFSVFVVKFYGFCLSIAYRPFHVGVASRLANAIYVAMVMPILYDNSYSLNDSDLKYDSYRPYGWFFKKSSNFDC